MTNEPMLTVRARTKYIRQLTDSGDVSVLDFIVGLATLAHDQKRSGVADWRRIGMPYSHDALCHCQRLSTFQGKCGKGAVMGLAGWVWPKACGAIYVTVSSALIELAWHIQGEGPHEDDDGG